ncbi:MAG TPA: hypothetical protein PKM41_06835 [Deltaproteobacteria bacterium]|jgi:hypothetical protein|nr:hypothetical protein [Deltaproteobacteria bacterium]HOI06825.1 hypothetical protein [Deltaproteobacteria bacterium]
MAPFTEHRVHIRNRTRIPSDVECVSCGLDDCFRATIYNVNGDGLYLESDHPLDRGQGILIHTLQHVPAGLTDGRDIDDNAGIVRWTRSMERNGRQLFGAGVRFFYPGLGEDREALDAFEYYCDLCSKAVGRKIGMRRSDELWMCPRCSTFVDHLPTEIHYVTMRYLIGNVL